MLNKTIMMGRMVKDPELRRTAAGKPVVSFTLAVERDFASNGEKQTDFIDHVAWNNTAEFVSKHFSKGSMMATVGSLQNRDWTDKDGNKRRVAEILVSNVYFAEGKKSDSKPVNVSYEEPGIEANTEFSELADDDGDLPF